MPFCIAAGCVIDIEALTCHSKTFGYTWKLHMKRPQIKDERTLDAALATGKRVTFPTAMPFPKKKPRWSWELEEAEMEAIEEMEQK